MSVCTLALVSVACAPAPAPTTRASTPRPGCEDCHAEISAEWQQSYHRAAFSDATFQRSLALEAPKDRQFCVDCHAPEANTAGVHVGVGCASCHERPHSGARTTTNTCNPCHQFTFDDGRADLVQRTTEEHAASAFATASCESCHMPWRGDTRRHRDHRFVSAHSSEQLRHGVSVRLAPLDARRVHVHIESYAGHAFPTGDMFRRARLLVFAERADGAIVDSFERVFGRTWGAVEGGPQAGHRRELGDTRLRGSHEEELAFDDDAAIARVRYELRFERVLAVRAGEATLESSEIIAEGVVTLP